ncbi:MAG: hypothetical protein K8R68_01835 [Bacteroidales bacterium]|nr:hypothetical protein [Bacteroidales bacterium]
MTVKKSENSSNNEKLREELFEIRVDVQVYKRSFKILVTSVVIITAIIAYFGYDKIDTIQKDILKKANQRLAQTDSLLSNIDQSKLDTLNIKLSKKVKEYELTLANFDLVLQSNKELENKLFATLNTNKRVEYPLKSLYQHSPEDFFKLKKFPNVFKPNEKLDLFLSFSDSFELSSAEVLKLEITKTKNDQLYQVKDYSFEVQQRLNKLSITLDIAKGKYILDVGFIKKDKEKYHFYRFRKNIVIK